MKAILSTGLMLALLTCSSHLLAQPKSIELEYAVSQNGHVFGAVKESYTREGDQYHITSTTEGIGLYSLLGKQVRTSEGRVTATGLVPATFKYKRGDNERKSRTANFDWMNKTLNMLAEGDVRKATLSPGAQDLASFPYQFMFAPPQGKQVEMAVTTGKKIESYTYNIIGRDVALSLAGVTYQTIHLAYAEAEGKKKKELWLAPDKDYIPVKYLFVDKHGDKIEQVITKITIK